MQLIRPTPEIWPIVKPLIEKACKRNNGRYQVEDVKKWLDEGDWQLWAAIENQQVKAICLTEIVIYPGAKVCRINIGTGIEREKWQDFRVLIEYWAKEMGCNKMESIARKGWSKIFKDYQQTHIFLEKEI